jgi:uncharacterized protein
MTTTESNANTHPNNKPTASLNGVGIGLRLPHIQQIIDQQPEIDWLEIHSCNFIDSPTNLALLDKVAERYRLSFHGVSLNLGGTDHVDADYLSRLKRAIDRYQPALISDHACFTAVESKNYHDLLPIPYTSSAVNHMAQRISQVQDCLGRQILLENVSRYFTYPEQDLTEAQFLNEVAAQSGCGLLLDINNAFVNQINHQEDAIAFMRQLSPSHIKELHLGGHHHENGILIDSHSAPIDVEVWKLFSSFINTYATAVNAELPPVLIEWDSQLPPLETLVREQQLATQLIQDCTRQLAKRCDKDQSRNVVGVSTRESS